MTSNHFAQVCCSGIVVAFLISILLCFPAISQDGGLHNSSKVFSAPADLSWQHWDAPEELERTWRAAIVRVPIGPGHSKQVTTEDLQKGTIAIERKLPTVIYLHGCSGFWPGSFERIKFLADNGFLVIAPASLARKTYPRSCNVETREGGLFRGTLVLRNNDAGYAIEKARKIKIVDGEKIVLMGFSEGALAAVTFQAQNPQQHVRARIAEGWTCHAPWTEYRGVNAAADEPVLTLLGAGDPWHQNKWTKGECAPFLNTENGSKSIVYDTGELSHKHGLLEFQSAQQDVLEFLHESLSD